MTSERSALDRFEELASQHGLELAPRSLELVRLGSFFDMAEANARDGTRWILKIPKNPGAIAFAENEHRAQTLARAHLTCAVPDWTIFSPHLIAGVRLPHHPLVEAPRKPSERFLDSLAEQLACLHGTPLGELRGSGLAEHGSAELRARWQALLTQPGAFPEPWVSRWRAWLADDSYWPTYATFVHGRLSPTRCHVDLEGRITGLLDWGEAHWGDPALDFARLRLGFGRRTFDSVLSRYVIAEDRAWPRLRDHALELATFLSRQQLRTAATISLDEGFSAEPDEPGSDPIP